MNLAQRKSAFIQLGKFLDEFIEKKEWKNYSNGVSQADFNDFNEVIVNVRIYNGWFTENMVRKSIGGIRSWLKEDNLNQFCDKYPIEKQKSKKIALLLAGNIPFVGFHDVLCSLLCGHSVLLKFSSDDNKLIPLLLKYLVQIEPLFYNFIRIADGKLNDFDAVIATGSDNTNRYFESYFSKYPHIFRGNRTSLAILTGAESREELVKLGHDVFDFYGLGCRNISKVFVPKNYDTNKLFDAFFEFKEIINHNKYANNYDYNKAVFLLEQTKDLIENGFLLLKKEKELHSPLAVLFYDEYENIQEVNEYIETKKDNIQCVVGHDYIPFGSAQSPAINDFADGIDTMKFLTTLQ